MYSNILVPVDLTHGEVCERMLKLARRIGGTDASITLLNVMEALPAYVETQVPPDIISRQQTEVREKLLALARSVDPDAKVAVRHGHPSPIILDEAKQIGADAIVMAAHRPDFRDYLIGSTAGRVVRHATCSVVVDRIRT